MNAKVSKIEYCVETLTPDKTWLRGNLVFTELVEAKNLMNYYRDFYKQLRIVRSVTHEDVIVTTFGDKIEEHYS